MPQAATRSMRWRTIPYVFVLLFVPLLFSVSRLHRQDAVETLSKRIHSKKSDHLVIGPAAGQGLADRLQCDGLTAVNKVDTQSPHHKLQSGESVSFVTVFTVYNRPNLDSAVEDRSSNVVTVGEKSYNKVERSMAIINTFVHFIQVAMPRSNIILLTDPASGFIMDRSSVTVLPIQGDYSRGNLMLQRIRSYIAFLDRRLENLEGLKNSHYIFTDSDIAVVGELGHLFQKYPDFHLALTFRNNKDQPLNSGFIAVRGTQDAMLKAKILLQEVLEAYTLKYMNNSRMLGDQLALVWVIKTHLPAALKKFSRHEDFIDEINGASVLFLPCAIYNWTPPEGAGQFHGMPLDVQVVHFKGSRKRLMLESWNFYNSTSRFSDMLCLILRSGRTKYDF